MAQLKQKSSMTPFLRISAGEFFVTRLISRELVIIKGEERDCLVVDVYHAEKSDGNLPGAADIVKMLNNTPVRSLIGANKAIVDALWVFDDENKLKHDPTGGFYLFSYGGKQKISGGKSFNSWQVYDITLTDSERARIEASDAE